MRPFVAYIFPHAIHFKIIPGNTRIGRIPPAASTTADDAESAIAAYAASYAVRAADTAHVAANATANATANAASATASAADKAYSNIDAAYATIDAVYIIRNSFWPVIEYDCGFETSFVSTTRSGGLGYLDKIL